VNDTLGHAAGDELLRAVATRLRTVVREGDVVARVGGDEFLVLLPEPGPSATDPEAIEERLCSALELPVELRDTEVYVAASVGLAAFPADGADAETLLRVADARMYREKRGRSSIGMIGSPRPAEDELGLSSRLRASAKNDAWALRYQPIVELVEGRTIGAEALVRWNDPVRGLRPPHDFLDLAHELDLGEQLTRWVIDELGSVGLAWREDGVIDDLTMLTFNLSPRQLWATTLIERLRRLAETLARPQMLVVEVTEDAVAMDIDRARVVLGQCRRAGIRIALDDFGTGYSSLARLGSLPIDIVKVDRGFLSGIEQDADSRRVLRSMIRLISSLDMVAIAEGVEDPRQLDVVIDEGFVLAQGFLFGPPMSEERFRHELDEAHQAWRWVRHRRPMHASLERVVVG
jgi:predicted signal transduction protein with EAL and GGDEF domain